MFLRATVALENSSIAQSIVQSPVAPAINCSVSCGELEFPRLRPSRDKTLAVHELTKNLVKMLFRNLDSGVCFSAHTEANTQSIGKPVWCGHPKRMCIRSVSRCRGVWENHTSAESQNTLSQNNKSDISNSRHVCLVSTVMALRHHQADITCPTRPNRLP